MTAPAVDTEVRLPLAKLTVFVAVRTRLLNCASVAASVGSPTPKIRLPDGARTVPPCTMSVASTSKVPPADNGTLDAPFDSKVIVVGGGLLPVEVEPLPVNVGPTAAMMKVVPVDGYRSAALKLR